MAGAITGIPEVDNMTPSQAFHAGRRCSSDEIARLRALLLKAYQFISPHSDPMGLNNTQMAAEIMRALEQQFDGGKT